MNGYVLFKMWEPFRQSLIEAHLFYVEQARKRLLSQFNGIEADAEQAGKDWLERNSRNFNPDQDDPGDFYERAHDEGIEFYELLSNMHNQTRLSVAAGMFHQWDKQLRDWLAQEVHHWHRGDSVSLKIWSADFRQIAELLETFDWNICATDYFRSLDACRLVVNVYKHGQGKSLDELKDRFPEFLVDPVGGVEGISLDMSYRDHTHLQVSDDQLTVFSNAILEFWRNVPANVISSQRTEVPDWFGKAIQKDQTETRVQGKT